MRIKIIAGLLLLFSLQAEAQNTSTYDAQSLKEKKIIVALKEYPKKASEEAKIMIDSSNASLKFAMNNYWNFNEVTDYMPLSEAKEFVKSNKDTHCYITIDLGVSKSLKKGNNDYIVGNAYQYVSYAERLGIYAPGLTSSAYLPHYQGPLNKPSAVFATMQLQKVLDLLFKEEFTSVMGSRSYVRNNGPKIKNKTLLIPKEYVSTKLSAEEIKASYPFDMEICDISKIENAILEKNSDYAVIYHVPLPVGGKFIYRLYVSNSEDGDVYGVADGSKINVDLGIFGDTGKKDYLINAKVLKQISKIVE